MEESFAEISKSQNILSRPDNQSEHAHEEIRGSGECW